MRSISSENIDEILFDYFEGNLSEYDKKDVKRFIDDNPDYLEDFRLWEVSNVKYSSVEIAVDRSLLKTSYSIYIREWLFVACDLIALSALLIMMQVNRPKNDFTEKKENFRKVEIIEQKKTVWKKELVRNNKILKVLKPIKNYALIIPLDSLSANETFASQRKIIIEDSTAVLKQEVYKKDTIVDSLDIQDKISSHLLKKNLSKREERKITRDIQRYKQKVKDQRQQEEFVKRDKPYVVPLSPKNF